MTKLSALTLLVALAVTLMMIEACGNDLPECPQLLVDGKVGWSHPEYISRCTYQGQVVYYTPAQCCDIPSVVYDEECNDICWPSGGYAGGGDGRCPDFNEEDAACEKIWKR